MRLVKYNTHKNKPKILQNARKYLKFRLPSFTFSNSLIYEYKYLVNTKDMPCKCIMGATNKMDFNMIITQ